MENSSQLVFVLGGLNQSVLTRQVWFGLALTAYLFTLLVNLTLIGTVLLEKTRLHQPMYFFLCNLCMNGICGASSFYPKLLHDLLADAHVVSYAGCVAQMFVSYSYIFCEFTSLTVMAYDRYVAICWPLRYRELMTPRRVALLLLLTWTFSLLETAVGLVLVLRLPLCGRRLSKMFCTDWELVKLACPPASYDDAYGSLITALHLSQAALIVVSYARLIRTAARSRSDRRKFLQTCVPHLAALLVFTGSLLFDGAFSRYGGTTVEALQNALAAEFLVLPPALNPIIYGLNLKEVRSRIHSRFGIRPKLSV
ncbi:hypothetical protein OJAV_G00134800 [Oryzias javanicus]|uniref:Olfactory receptor n=1 Tax=Oryzias javanicus TaxID=123683 RepID=A0A437CR60_ORYJA|nr:hypothetical protein OJAV_G00134800 [Oryzias javanicus]